VLGLVVGSALLPTESVGGFHGALDADEPRGFVVSNLDADALFPLGRLPDIKVGESVDAWFGIDPRRPIHSEAAQAAIRKAIVDEAWAASDS
jgi:hypothetical protein